MKPVRRPRGAGLGLPLIDRAIADLAQRGVARLGYSGPLNAFRASSSLVSTSAKNSDSSRSDKHG